MANPTAKYVSLAAEEIGTETNRLESIFRNFLEHYERTSFKEFALNKDDLIEVIERVDQRKDYYYYYHEIETENVSEYKEVALIAYWIIKLKPFRMENPSSDLYDYVNEQFALYLIHSILHQELKHQGLTLKMASGKYMDDLKYSLKYHDISKEAMIDIVESLAENYSSPEA